MINLIKRDCLIGLREFKVIAKWLLILTIFLFIASACLSSFSTESKDVKSIKVGVCCNLDSYPIESTETILYEFQNELESDFFRNILDVAINVGSKPYIKYHEPVPQFISKNIQTYYMDGDTPIAMFSDDPKSDAEWEARNAIWVFCCLISLLPIALSETIVGKDFRSGRLSELIVSTGNRHTTILAKYLSISILSIGFSCAILLVAGFTLITSTAIMLSNSTPMLTLFRDASPIAINHGDILEIASVLLSFSMDIGAATLFIIIIVLSLQISSFVMIINLYGIKNATIKSLTEKSVAVWLWIPLIFSLPNGISQYLPFYSSYALTLTLSPGHETNYTYALVSLFYILASTLLVLYFANAKRDWPISN